MKLIVQFLTTLILLFRVSGTNEISSYLRDCYSEPGLVNRNNLAPMTLNVLLDILRKIEDHNDVMGDMRQISTGLVHKFRLDGIIYDPSVESYNGIVPFSPTGFPAYKNRLLLNKLIPNDQLRLPDSLLMPEEKCTLHQMISTSLHMNTRGDDERICDRVGSNSRLSIFDKQRDVEIFNVNGLRDIRDRQVIGTSRCPIETGVILTSWGEVSLGPVISGISAGFEEQNVLVSDLVNLKRGFESSSSLIVNNRYAATLSGDIAEVAIRQGTSRFAISIGASGGWNNTYANRYYFNSKNIDLELTDAEIRGDLDGLVLSEIGPAYAGRFPEMKLSQLIDMYYSHNGIFHEKRFRACNRIVLVPDIASEQKLIDESLGTTVALYHVSPLEATTNPKGLTTFLNNTVGAFLNYLPTHLSNQHVCDTTNVQTIRPKLNLILITEPTNARSEQVAYIVNELNIGKFGSSISFVDSSSGEVLIERTFSITDFYIKYAKILVARSGTFNVINALKSTRDILTKYKDISYAGGNSSVILFLADHIEALERELFYDAVDLKNEIAKVSPESRIIIASSSSTMSSFNFLLDSLSDFISVTPNSLDAPSVKLSALVTHLEHLPRNIVNPICSLSSGSTDPGTTGFDDFVDAEGINLYSIAPSFFYDYNIERIIIIQSTNYGSISVCYSWSNTFPRRNSTTSMVPDDVICDSVASEGIVEMDLSRGCDGSSLKSCPTFYFTVASTTILTTLSCKDPGCRFPDDVKYVVITKELGCHNAAVSSYISFVRNTMFVFLFLYFL